MNLIRTILATLLIVAICLTIFRSELMIHNGIAELSWGWMISYLFPKLLVLLLTALFIWAIWFRLKLLGHYKFIVILLLLGFSTGGYLLVNKPYIEWVKKGTDTTAEPTGNPVELYLNQYQPGFEGLITLVLPDCPYCVSAIPKLSLLQKRSPELNLAVFVFTKDSTGVEKFLDHVGETTVPVSLVPEPEESAVLCKGRFPTFLYFKDGKVVHRWSNNQLGYPALDWIEAGLN